MTKAKYIMDTDKLTMLSQAESARLKPVTDKFVFRVNDYYLRLIDWNDPHDPTRKLIIPDEGELKEYDRWDASNDVKEAMSNVQQGIDYIREHPEINNVLLTGGDSLILDTGKIELILRKLREIEHVRIIRLGFKIPVFNPMRIYEDPMLLEVIRKYSIPEKRIYVMAHINHPREITFEAKQVFQALHDAGAIVVNQTPVLKGINDDPAVLSELLDKLSWPGVTPYYFFIYRPVAGNREFVLSLEQVYRIVEEAKSHTSGPGKRVRLVMSHTSGKIEILAIENGKAYLKYHQSREGQYGSLMILECPEEAAWFEDLPGSEAYWNKPEKKAQHIISVNQLPDFPGKRMKSKKQLIDQIP